MVSSSAQTGGTLTVPVVDRLTVKVLTDSSYDTPRPSSSPWVKVRRTALAAPGDFGKTLHNEWALALALQSQVGNETLDLMLDFGYTVEALLNDMEMMAVDPSKVHPDPEPRPLRSLWRPDRLFAKESGQIAR